MSKLFVIVLAFVILGCAFAAPSEEKEVEKREDAKPKADDNADRAVVVSEPSTWETMLSSNAYNIVINSLAAVFVIGGLALGFYYFYYLNQVGYTNVDAYSGYTAASQTYPYSYGQYYQTAARALSGGNGFSFARVLDMIAMAQETYERFDFQSLDCQKKALCELQQKQADFGETGRKISSTFTFFDALQDLPMPTIIQNYLKEYKEAIMQGKNSSKDCSFIYPKCDFSIKDVFVKYSKKLNRVNKDKDM